MKKYILDTSVIIFNPDCFKLFKESEIIIPIKVVEELDKLKSKSDICGANARRAIRVIDHYVGKQNPTIGIDIGNNVRMYIDNSNRKSDNFLNNNNDDFILSCAESHKPCTLLSRDISMRLRGASFEINVEDYTCDDDERDANDVYLGYRKIDLDEMSMTMDANILNKGVDTYDSVFEDMYPNECCVIINEGKKSIYRKHGDGVLKPIKLPNNIWSITSKNMEQAFALDILLDPNVPLVTLAGKAGCGKTLLAVGAALEQTINSPKRYNFIEFYKPPLPVGKDLGFLPGDIDEKLAPWMGSIKDALRVLNKNEDNIKHYYGNIIRFEALSYIRGRSLTNTYILCDEFQNTNKVEVKLMITRLGFGSKVVCTGDLEQQDSTYLGFNNNGLANLIEKFKKSKLAGHITLLKGERSPLATEASLIL